MLRKLICSLAASTVEISKDGDIYTLKTISTMKTIENKFKLDEEFDDKLMDGRECQVWKSGRDRPRMTSASDIKRPDPSPPPLPVSHPTKMVPHIRLQAPPSDMKASAVSNPLTPTPWLTSFLDGPKVLWHIT